MGVNKSASVSRTVGGEGYVPMRGYVRPRGEGGIFFNIIIKYIFRLWYHFGALHIISVFRATNYADVMSGTLQVTHTSGTVRI